ncbi:MAG TPA: hypothetical protein VF179_19100, partial [Thermoanaerobaculia bacterium]|nr:hypothetical protein [Thermoanaerobaculia bacterium]
VSCTRNNSRFDLNNGTLELRESGGAVEVWQGTRWGHSGTQSGTATKVVIIGTHHSGNQEFEITCVQDSDGNWSQDGELKGPKGGGDGTWTAQESP